MTAKLYYLWVLTGQVPAGAFHLSGHQWLFCFPGSLARGPHFLSFSTVFACESRVVDGTAAPGRRHGQAHACIMQQCAGETASQPAPQVPPGGPLPPSLEGLRGLVQRLGHRLSTAVAVPRGLSAARTMTPGHSACERSPPPV
jgi:hypothetical protein